MEKNKNKMATTKAQTDGGHHCGFGLVSTEIKKSDLKFG